MRIIIIIIIIFLDNEKIFLYFQQTIQYKDKTILIVKAKDLELQKPFTSSGAHIRKSGYKLNILNLITSFSFLTSKDGEITRACQIQSLLAHHI